MQAEIRKWACILKADPENGCLLTICPHNMFWDGLKLPKGAHITGFSLSFSNCMCLLDEEWTLEDIAELWGMTRERIRQIERDAIIKLLSKSLGKHKFMKEFSLSESFIRKKLELLRAKKHKSRR